MIQDRFRLDDQVAIVTGAGRGIGAASAIALAEAGADVVLSSRTKEQLDAVAAQIEALGRRAVVVPADLSDLDAVAGLAEIAQQELGRIDIVVNNVGGSMPRPFLDTSPEPADPRVLLERGHRPRPHAGRRADHARDAAAGPWSGISSMMGRTAGRGFVAYGTAKAALSHWTRLAAQDLAPRIRVNAIAVGSIATSALEIVLEDDEPAHRHGAGHAAQAHRRPRGDRGHGPLPRVARRRLRHRQGRRGRRRHRAAQPRHGPARPLTALGRHSTLGRWTVGRRRPAQRPASAATRGRTATRSTDDGAEPRPGHDGMDHHVRVLGDRSPRLATDHHPEGRADQHPDRHDRKRVRPGDRRRWIAW